MDSRICQTSTASPAGPGGLLTGAGGVRTPELGTPISGGSLERAGRELSRLEQRYRFRPIQPDYRKFIL